MRIGIAGAHRTGKTTLAERINQKLPFLHFARTSVSNAAVWENYGIEPDGQFTFVERLAIQRQLFDHMRNIVHSATQPAIFDRTYLDLLGYLYANIDSTCSTLYDDEVMSFTIQCMQATMQDFQKIIIVPPAIEPVPTSEKMGKVFMSRGYIEAINNHIISYAARSNIPFKIVPYEMTDIAERAAWCVNYIEQPTA